MNYKFIALGILIASPFLATMASHVPDMIPQKQGANAPAAPAEQPAALAPPAAVHSAAPAPAAMVSRSMPEFGAPNPEAGEPMVNTDASLPVAPIPVIQPPQPTGGVLPPYPGQYREPSHGTVYLPDGRKVG